MMMNHSTTSDGLPRELAYRAADGLEVWLLWTEADNRLFVLVVDSRLGGAFELTVKSSNALDAFHHPYAYAAFRGMEYEPAWREALEAA